MPDEKIYNTSDLPLAAYLMMKNLKLKNAKRSPGGKFEFIFFDPDEIAFSLALEFVNSDFCKFDNHLRSLKKILYKG
tara:strand:- start:285 stop:515 length:231 start_codon:yes stop_codon:yes gene_type:complete